jgi:hypothetical protein
VIPQLANSMAMVLLSMITAAFAAEYAQYPGKPTSPEIEPRLMILP